MDTLDSEMTSADSQQPADRSEQATTQPVTTKYPSLHGGKDNEEVKESESNSSASGGPIFKLIPQYPTYKSMIGWFDEHFVGEDDIAMAREQSSAASRDLERDNTVLEVGHDKGEFPLRSLQSFELTPEEMTKTLTPKDTTEVRKGESGGVIVDENKDTTTHLLNPHTN